MDGEQSMVKWQSLLVVACVWLGGCRVGLGGLLRELTGPSRGELLSDAFSDPKSPDEQREALEDMLGRYWGLDRKVLQCYALLATDKYTDSTVRSAALRAIAVAGEDAFDFIDHLAAALAAQPDNVRWDAAVALDRVVGPKAIDPLCTAVTRDENVDVRIASARALRHHRTTVVAGVLAMVLQLDPDYSVRKRAHESLVEIAGRDLGREAKDWERLTKHMPKRPLPPPPWWDIFHLTVKDESKEETEKGAEVDK